MINTFTVLFLALVLCLSGCYTQPKEVPTEPILSVTEYTIIPETEPEDEILPAIFLDGQCYYDTGLNHGADGRCGMMDGQIHSSCGSDEWPAEEGQSNFGSGFYYQLGPIVGTYEVQFDTDDWRIFACESVLQDHLPELKGMKAIRIRS